MDAPIYNFLLQNLGLLGDAANPTGDAMARLADLENKVGSINPNSFATSNLFQYLYLLQQYMNGGLSIPGLGMQGDAANPTGSANSKLLEIEVNRVGAQADPASATGSANAKLAYLIANLLSVEPAVVLGRTSIPGGFSTTSATLTNALSLSGKGTLTAFAATTAAGTTELKITVDGTVIMDTTAVVNTNVYGIAANPSASYPFAMNIIGSGSVGLVTIDFKSSLLIQAKGNGTNAITCGWVVNQ
jgi:hypothetical protein